jgi:hypothetical protein
VRYNIKLNKVYDDINSIMFIFAACLADKYGTNCENTCHCLNGPDDCDKETGKCKSWQCEWGWKNPPQCQTGILSL